jgi:hypothetical protein
MLCRRIIDAGDFSDHHLKQHEAAQIPRRYPDGQSGSGRCPDCPATGFIRKDECTIAGDTLAGNFAGGETVPSRNRNAGYGGSLAPDRVC